MRVYYSNEADVEQSIVDFPKSLVAFGSGKSNDVVLDSPTIADRAFVIESRGGDCEITVLGPSPVKIGTLPLRQGQRMVIDPSLVIRASAYTVRIEPDDNALAPIDPYSRQMEFISQWVKKIHTDLLDHPRYLALESAKISKEPTDQELAAIEKLVADLSHIDIMSPQQSRTVVPFAAGCMVFSECLFRLMDQDQSTASALVQKGAKWHRSLTESEPMRRDRESLTERLYEMILRESGRSDIASDTQNFESGFWQCWSQVKRSLDPGLLQGLAIQYLRKHIKDMLYGYGPLEDLLRSPSISEIMVVDSGRIFVEQGGVIRESGRRFISDEITENVITRIFHKIDREINKSKPMEDARLSDGSRVNAVLPPLAISGPCLTIRRFPSKRLTGADLLKRKAVTPSALRFLEASVINHMNIIVSGGTGTGKTTLLNCLCQYIADDERIITVEDTAEIQIAKRHVVRMETRPANNEGKGAYTIRDLVRNALRMRPNRIIVGECRGGEALDMLQAMNTGHSGSLTTIHANTSADAILRLEVLIQQAGENLTNQSIYHQIASAINLIVQLQRCRDGRRRIKQITEVVGYDDKRGTLRMHDIFFARDEDGSLEPTGHLPRFLGDLLQRGSVSLEDFFPKSIADEAAK